LEVIKPDIGKRYRTINLEHISLIMLILQEEASSLGKPVLVMRDITERPKAVDVGTLEFVGTDKSLIIDKVNELINDSETYQKMFKAHSPYGDGKASSRILNYLK